MNTLRAALIAISLTFTAFAQGALSISASGVARPGGVITLTLSYSAADTAALQWTLTPPAGVLLSAPTSLVLGKTVSCRAANDICILYSGSSVAVIPAGPVATVKATFPATLGPRTFTLTGTLGSSAAAAPVVVTVGAPLAITVVSKYDLNGDSLVNSADITIAVNQYYGGCAIADINADTRCDVVDVMTVVLAVLGLIPL